MLLIQTSFLFVVCDCAESVISDFSFSGDSSFTGFKTWGTVRGGINWGVFGLGSDTNADCSFLGLRTSKQKSSLFHSASSYSNKDSFSSPSPISSAS